MVENIEHFKQKLEDEKTQLEEQLADVGNQDPNDPLHWEAKASDLSVDQADRNEVADASEESQENRAILEQLLPRYKNVVRALKKIEDGTYGTCEISGGQIELDRLEANPAARTGKGDMEREGELPD